MPPIDPIEVIAALFGIASIYFSVKRRVAVYPVGLVSILCYIYICYAYGIYADMGIQILFGIMSIQGWWAWYFVRQQDYTVAPRLLGERKLIFAFLVALLLWPVIAYFLINYSDSNVVWMDSFTTAFSIVGMWLMVYQYLAHWLLWVIVNTVSIPLYLYKKLYFSSIFYFVALVMAVYGWVSWKRKLALEKASR